MSKFSGKCDFYDEIEIFGLEKILSAKVYLGRSDTPLELCSLADCVPYFPHIVYMANHIDGHSVIRLSEKSWVDIEEERYGPTRTHKYYREFLAEELAKAERDGDAYECE